MDPAYQRKGAATQLIETVYRKAAAQGQALVLVLECSEDFNVICGLEDEYESMSSNGARLISARP